MRHIDDDSAEHPDRANDEGIARVLAIAERNRSRVAAAGLADTDPFDGMYDDDGLPV